MFINLEVGFLTTFSSINKPLVILIYPLFKLFLYVTSLFVIFPFLELKHSVFEQ